MVPADIFLSAGIFSQLAFPSQLEFPFSRHFRGEIAVAGFAGLRATKKPTDWLAFLVLHGAGEEIRTLDFDLGKVALYP